MSLNMDRPTYLSNFIIYLAKTTILQDLFTYFFYSDFITNNSEKCRKSGEEAILSLSYIHYTFSLNEKKNYS